MYEEGGKSSLIQIQGLRAVPFAAASPNDDCKMFSDLTWDLGVVDGRPDYSEKLQRRRSQHCVRGRARCSILSEDSCAESIPDDVQKSLEGQAARFLRLCCETPLAETGRGPTTPRSILISLVAK